MRGDSRSVKVEDFLRSRLEAGISPTYVEIGEAVGMSGPGAWKHVQRMMDVGKFERGPDGRPRLAKAADLRGIATARLRGELARRGVTLDALEEPQPLWNSGRTCAANHCPERVRRGHLMCRRHWFKLPRDKRSAITNAWSARQTQAYQEAVEDARDYLGGFTTVVERML